MPHLLIRTEGHEELRFPLGEVSVLIGRSADKDICLRDLTVSNNHAKLSPEGAGWRFRDLGSTNGSFVNDSLQRDAVLNNGDVIRVGNTEMEFCDVAGEEDEADDQGAGDVQAQLPSKTDSQGRQLTDLFSHTVSLTLDEIESDLLKRKLSGVVSDGERFLQQKLAVLYQLGKHANRLEKLERFLPKLTSLVREAVGGDRVFVMLIDPESGDLVPRSYDGIKGGDGKGVSSTILECVISERSAILTHDALTDPRFSDGESVVIMRIRGVMCVPLGVKQMVYGALYVDSLTQTSTFDTEDLRLLGVIGSQASIILRNIQLFEDQRRTNAELRKAQERINAWNKELEKKVEERTAEIKDQAAEIQRLADLKDELLGIAAHDLRTPLTVIHGYAQMLGMSVANDMVEPERLSEDIATIEHTALEMTDLLNDLLDVSKIEAGRIHIAPTATDGQRLVMNCFRLHELWARSKGIDLRVEVDGQTASVMCDGKRIQQVLNNLLSNAVKFSSSGDTVTLRMQPRGDDAVEFAVEDTGQGIDPADLPKLFGKFEQVSSKATGGEKGTGLGLAIAKKLVELHGGRIDVRSMQGTGSRFFFVLPLADGLGPAPAAGSAAASGTAAA
jgi:signal transduction histidine kinase